MTPHRHDLRTLAAAGHLDSASGYPDPDSGTLAIVERKPSVSEFHALRLSVNWSISDVESTRRAIQRSLLALCAEVDGVLVGMCRVVGDGLYFYVQDVIVAPQYQGRGIARSLMERVTVWLDRFVPDNTYVALVAEPGLAPFYEKFGFERQSSLILRRR